MSRNNKHLAKNNNGRSLLQSTSPEFYFKVVDGSEIKSLAELADALDRMSDDSFFYHANEQRNDFANWIRDIFSEQQLAEQMTKCNSRLGAEVCLLRHFVREINK